MSALTMNDLREEANRVFCASEEDESSIEWESGNKVLRIYDADSIEVMYFGGFNHENNATPNGRSRRRRDQNEVCYVFSVDHLPNSAAKATPRNSPVSSARRGRRGTAEGMLEYLSSSCSEINQLYPGY